MDGRRFDDLTRALGAPGCRRGFLKGLLGAGLAAAGIRRFSESAADAQVSQIYCGNQMCASNPGGCRDGCVCCVYTSPVTGRVTNSRCRPPGTCSPGTTVCPPGQVLGPSGGCAAPTTTTTTTAPAKPLGSACANGTECESGFCTDGVCCSREACGNCEVCGSQGACVAAAEGAPCTPSDFCFTEGRCTSGGACFAVGAPRQDCPAGPCEQGFCESGRCQTRPVPGEPTCGPGGECFSLVCRGGSCDKVPTNPNQSCSGGTACNPNVCIDGDCTPAPERANGSSCPGGICSNGVCCQGATEDGICATEVHCCASQPCCGLSCCEECFAEPSTSGGENLPICCPEGNLCPPNDPEAPFCCYGDETCIETDQGYSCIDDRLICGGTTVCGDACCGDSCCTDGQYCQTGGGCAAVPDGPCLTDADCGSDLTCTGVEEGFGENGPVVVQLGSCCPSIRACPAPNYSGPGSGSPNYCVAYGQRCDFNGMTCSYPYFLSCGGSSCECSPRGSRTRL